MMVLLNHRQKLKMVQILIMMVIGAALETCSIALVIPAIQVIIDPSCVEGDGIVARAYRLTGLENPTSFMILILGMIILGFVLKNIFLYFQNVVQLRFVYTNQFETSQRMMINFMKRPYEYYLNADTSVIQRMITSDVNNMYGLILACLQLVSEVIIFVFLTVNFRFIAYVPTKGKRKSRVDEGYDDAYWRVGGFAMWLFSLVLLIDEWSRFWVEFLELTSS